MRTLSIAMMLMASVTVAAQEYQPLPIGAELESQLVEQSEQEQQTGCDWAGDAVIVLLEDNPPIEKVASAYACLFLDESAANETLLMYVEALAEYNKTIERQIIEVEKQNASLLEVVYWYEQERSQQQVARRPSTERNRPGFWDRVAVGMQGIADQAGSREQEQQELLERIETLERQQGNEELDEFIESLKPEPYENPWSWDEKERKWRYKDFYDFYDFDDYDKQ